MNCSRCGQPLTEGAASCASCGAPTGVAAPAAQAAPAGPSTQIPAYKFDSKQWTNTDKVIGVAAVVLFISLFLPWYGVSVGLGSFTADGLTAHGYLYIVLILLLGEIGYLAARAGWHQVRTKAPLPHHQILLIVNVINLVLVVIAFLDKGPSGIGWRFGAFVGLAAAIVAAAPRLANQVMNRRKSA
jgi:hypothetical protein